MSKTEQLVLATLTPVATIFPHHQKPNSFIPLHKFFHTNSTKIPDTFTLSMDPETWIINQFAKRDEGTYHFHDFGDLENSGGGYDEENEADDTVMNEGGDEGSVHEFDDDCTDGEDGSVHEFDDDIIPIPLCDDDEENGEDRRITVRKTRRGRNGKNTVKRNKIIEEEEEEEEEEDDDDSDYEDEEDDNDNKERKSNTKRNSKQRPKSKTTRKRKSQYISDKSPSSKRKKISKSSKPTRPTAADTTTTSKSLQPKKRKTLSQNINVSSCKKQKHHSSSPSSPTRSPAPSKKRKRHPKKEINIEQTLNNYRRRIMQENIDWSVFHNAYISDFNLSKTLKSSSSSSLCVHHAQVLAELAKKFNFCVLGFVSENKRAGKYIENLPNGDLRIEEGGTTKCIYVGSASPFTGHKDSLYKVTKQDTVYVE